MMAEWIIFALVVGFALGNLIGTEWEAARWRAKANSYYRVESRGALFRVTLED